MSDPMRYRSSWIWLGAGLWISLAPATLAIDLPWPDPVKRVTDDRDADLIEALINDGQLDQAAAICDAELAAGDALSDPTAKWVVRRSQVENRRQMISNDFDDNRVTTATAVIDELLRQYPQHPRSLFLRAASLDVLDAAARHDVVTAVVMPSQSDRSERAINRLTKLGSQIRKLIQQVDAEVAIHESLTHRTKDDIDHKRYAADLIRLRKELRTDLVSIALVKTELFRAGSRDRLAAATAAEETADQAIVHLPVDSQARREVERLRVQAILRSGDHQRARRDLAQLKRTLPEPQKPVAQAVDVRISLAAGDLNAAAKQLDAFYGESPAQSPRSIEMDLVRLEYLMSAGGQPIGQWLDFIEQRGGAYARRRAEAISLARLRSNVSSTSAVSSQSNPSSRAVDPSMVAAQGQDWLRRDEPQRAAELLAAAAEAETDPDRALRYAKQSAAAWTSAGKLTQAATVLASVSRQNAAANDASAMHLQAAFIEATENTTGGAHRVEALLRESIRRWPTSESAGQARRWLVNLLTRQDRLVEAAQAATPSESGTTVNAPQFAAALQSWKAAMHAADPSELTQIGQRMTAALAPFLVQESFATAYRSAAVLLLEREQLADLPTAASESDTSETSFANALLAFRQNRAQSPALREPPENMVDDAVWRLMIDGQRFPNSRSVIAELIDQWPTTSTNSDGHVRRLIWLDNVDQAVALLRRRIRSSDRPGTELKAAAELLAASGNPAAQARAIDFWDELAAGIARDTRPWHEAKLSAIRLLSQTNRRDEASRRSKYVILTSPPKDDDLLTQYNRFSRSSTD